MKPIPFNAIAKMLGQKQLSQALVMGAAIDSRKVKAGDLFFALPGNRVDGHSFLKEAKSRGAVAAVVKSDYKGDTFGLPVLKVADVLFTLQDFARKKLQTRKSKVVAITGSLGKTTTKDFAAALLRTRYSVFANPLSYNSQATVPLTILMADETEDFLVLEMGMTHPGQIKSLLSIAPPDIALLTTVALQHVNNFSNGLEGICHEKTSIFSHPKTSLGIFHKGVSDHFDVSKVGSCKKLSFSIDDRTADYFLEIEENQVRVFFEKKECGTIDVSFPLRVYYQNFLASVALAHSLDVPWSFILEEASRLKLPPMRFERVEKMGITFINDAYNANPDAMKAALESLPDPKDGGKKIAVLSEMDALGAYSEKCHLDVAEKALECADVLFCIGSRCQAMKEVWEMKNKPVLFCESKEVLVQKLKEYIHAGDIVLLKGARAYALDNILENF